MNIYEYQFRKNYEKIYRILSIAKKHTVYYRKRLNHDIDYYLQSYDNWCELPIVSKDILRTQYNDFLNNTLNINENEFKEVHTSGSTATPLKIHKNKKTELRLLKRLWDVRRVWNKRIREWPLLYLYRSVDDIYENVFRLGNNDEFLDLSNNSLNKYVEQIQSFNPKWIIGPPIALSTICSHMLENNIKIYGVELAELFGEMVLPHHKYLINKALGCKTINHYGARELGVLSYECKCGHMHAWDDFYMFEIIPNPEMYHNDSIGQLIVTSFTNDAVPLIRYSLEDVCELRIIQENDCYSNNSKLELIPTLGRSSNLVYTKDRVVSSGVFDTVFSRIILKYPLSIKQFQVKQINISVLEISIIKGINFIEQIINELIENIKLFLGDIMVNIKFVKILYSDLSGKIQSFIPMKKNSSDFPI